MQRRWITGLVVGALVVWAWVPVQAFIFSAGTLPPGVATGAISSANPGGEALTSNPLSQFAATTSAQLAGVLSDETGTGVAVFNTSPTLVTPILGTPTSGTLTNTTGLPIGSGVSGLGTGVATFLATPSSANLAAALTDETGTGVVVFSIGTSLSAGAGTASFKPSGTLYWQNPMTPNVDTHYITTTAYSLPANTMATNGDRLGLELTAFMPSTTVTSFTCNVGYSAFNTTTGVFTGGETIVTLTSTATGGAATAWGWITRTGAASDTFWNQRLDTGNGWQTNGWSSGSGVTWANDNNILCAVKDSVGGAAAIYIAEFRITYLPR